MSCSSASRESKCRKIIIPKGSIHPNETVVIEIPARLRNNSTVLAKRRSSSCPGAYPPSIPRPPRSAATPPPSFSRPTPKCLTSPRPPPQQQNQFVHMSQTPPNLPSYRMPSRAIYNDTTAGNYGGQLINAYPPQTPTPNTTYINCNAACQQSPWIKRREHPDISFQPPFASTPTRREGAPGGTRNTSAPAKPVASPVTFYGNENESYGGCPANFQPYKYPDHVSAGEYMSPIYKNLTPNTSSTEAYTEDFTDETESSGEIDDELMGKILRGEIGRVLVWPTPPDAAAAAAAANATYNRGNVTYNVDTVNQANLTHARENSPGDYESYGETDNELMGRQPVQCNPSQTPAANATYNRNPPYTHSPWIKRKEHPDISFQPPYASTPAKGEGKLGGARNTSAPVKPVASPVTFYGNENESYGGYPANFKPYKYPDHISAGEYMSPIEKNVTYNKIASNSSIETYTEEITEEFESSGSMDDELMGKILRGEIGRVLVWPTPTDAANANHTQQNVTYAQENLPANRNNLTCNARSLPSDKKNDVYNTTFTVAQANDFNRPYQQTYEVDKSCQPCSHDQSLNYDFPSTTSAETYTQQFNEEMFDSTEGEINELLLGNIIADEIGRVWPTLPGQANAGENNCIECCSSGTQGNATYAVSNSPNNQTYSKNVKFIPGGAENVSNFAPMANSTGIEYSRDYLEKNNYTYNKPRHNATVSVEPTSTSSDSQNKRCPCNSSENSFREISPTTNSIGIESSFNNVAPIANSTGTEYSRDYLEKNNYTYNKPHNATVSVPPTSTSSDNRNKKCPCNGSENSFREFSPLENSTGIESSFNNFAPIANSTDVADSFGNKTYKKTSKRRTKQIVTPQGNPNNISERSSCSCNKTERTACGCSQIDEAEKEAEILELERMEAAENAMLQTNLRNWQEARRRLVLDTAKLTSSGTSTNYNDDTCSC